MRYVAALGLLVAAAACQIDGEPSPETPAECEQAGGKVAMRNGLLVCDLPPTGGYEAAHSARATAGDADAGTHD